MFDNVSCAMTAKKTAKKFTALSEFLLCLFSYFLCCCGCAEIASSLTMKKILVFGVGVELGVLIKKSNKHHRLGSTQPPWELYFGSPCFVCFCWFFMICRLVHTGHGKPVELWNLRISLVRPGNSWNLLFGPWKSWIIKVLFGRLLTADDKASIV